MAWQRKIPFGYQVRNGRINQDQMCKLDHALEVSVGLLPLYNTI